MNYLKIYSDLIHRAQERSIDSQSEKHHIIPKSLGGTDKKTNIADLTPREHFVAHYILCKIYPNEPKMAFALWFMSQKNKCDMLGRKYRVTSRTYEYARMLFYKAREGYIHSEQTREKMRGRICTEEQNDANSLLQKRLIKDEKVNGVNRSKRLNSNLPHWTDNIQEVRSSDCPGIGWHRGRLSKGVKWWNNGVLCKMQKESPGPERIEGRLYSLKKL